MNYKPVFKLAALSSAVLIAVGAQAADKKPNVVFILADNVGYGDIGAYGGGELRGAPTPRLDQLAREGLRLTQFLVEPAPSPNPFVACYFCLGPTTFCTNASNRGSPRSGSSIGSTLITAMFRPSWPATAFSNHRTASSRFPRLR